MYRYTDNNVFSFYFLGNSGNEIPVSHWGELQNDFFSQLSILMELQENDLADYTEFTCEVESLEILKLKDFEKKILELPDIYPYEIFIKSDGVLTQNTLNLNTGFMILVQMAQG